MIDEAFVLSQSKYYNPALNGAIFDGPFKIYFSQAQESEALKIYFTLQKELAEYLESWEHFSKNCDKTFFIILYPNQESFEHSFGESSRGSLIVKESISESVIWGLYETSLETLSKKLCREIKAHVHFLWGSNNDCANPQYNLEKTLEV